MWTTQHLQQQAMVHVGSECWDEFSQLMEDAPWSVQALHYWFHCYSQTRKKLIKSNPCRTFIHHVLNPPFLWNCNPERVNEWPSKRCLPIKRQFGQYFWGIVHVEHSSRWIIDLRQCPHEHEWSQPGLTENPFPEQAHDHDRQCCACNSQQSCARQCTETVCSLLLDKPPAEFGELSLQSWSSQYSAKNKMTLAQQKCQHRQLLCCELCQGPGASLARSRNLSVSQLGMQEHKSLPPTQDNPDKRWVEELQNSVMTASCGWVACPLWSSLAHVCSVETWALLNVMLKDWMDSQPMLMPKTIEIHLCINLPNQRFQ